MADKHVLVMKLQAVLADVPADILKDAVDVCKAIGADTEVMPNVPSLEVLCAAAAILNEREKGLR